MKDGELGTNVSLTASWDIMESLTDCSHLAAAGMLSLLRKKPEKSRLNSMTSTPIKLATPLLRNTMPINRQMAAAAKLNRTRKRMNLKNSGQAGMSPVIG